MKVKELISKLSAFDSELDVVCYCESEDVLTQGHGFRVFWIDHVDSKEAERVRCENDIPSLKFGKSEDSLPIVFIDVISEF